MPTQTVITYGFTGLRDDRPDKNIVQVVQLTTDADGNVTASKDVTPAPSGPPVPAPSATAAR